MRLVEGEGIDWGAVRELLGASAEEVDTPFNEELGAMLLMSEELPSEPPAADWQLIELEEGVDPEDAEALAVLSAIEAKHAEFHVPPGVWNHPLNLPAMAIEQILVALGFNRPAGRQANAVGRIVGWPGPA